MIFYCGGARNLLPLAYERPAPDIRTKRSKTGNFCKKRTFRPKITQLALEFTHGFLSDYALPSQKFPTKITGNFSEHNREFYFNHLRESVCYLYSVCLQTLHRAKRLKLRHDTGQAHFPTPLYFLCPGCLSVRPAIKYQRLNQANLGYIHTVIVSRNTQVSNYKKG